MDQTLEIKCEASQYIPLDQFDNLQGNLKTLSEDDYVKLRNSITEFGFSFPIFFWQDESGKRWIVDAHQRLYTLRKMREEGWTIPDLPADRIHATDKREARKKLLLLNSRYGKMTDEGLSEFLNVEGEEIAFEEIGDLLTLPDVDFNKLWGGSENEEKNKELDLAELAKDLNIKCPKCGFEFKGKEGIETLDESS